MKYLTRKKSLLFGCALIFLLITGSRPERGWPAAEAAAAFCTECHADLQRVKYIHEPVRTGNCRACHGATADHPGDDGSGSIITDRSNKACYQCHNLKNKGRYVHPNLELEGGCLLCHDPHGSDNVNNLIRPKNLVCQECHNPIPADVKTEHGVMTDETSCMNCHDPHAAELDSLLISNMPMLCLNCHDREITTSEEGLTRQVKNIKEKVREMQYTHNPAIWCTSCHASHGSRYRNLLVANFPVENYALYESGDRDKVNTYELCFGCHDKKMLREDITAADTGFRNDTLRDNVVVRRNLHWFHVVDAAGSENKARGRSCAICHDPHGTANPHLINTTWTMKNFDLNIIFENRGDGGSCLKSCHPPLSYQRLD